MNTLISPMSRVGLNNPPPAFQKHSPASELRFSGQKWFGNEDKYGKKHWSINLTNIPMLDRALVYAVIALTGGLAAGPIHNLTPGGQQLNNLKTAYKAVVKDSGASGEALETLVQEKFRSFFTEFNQQALTGGGIDISPALSKFPMLTPEDIHATKGMIITMPATGSVQDIRQVVTEFKQDVLAEHFTPEQLAQFDTLANRQLDSLQRHENIHAGAALAAIIAASMAALIVVAGIAAVGGAVNKSR